MRHRTDPAFPAVQGQTTTSSSARLIRLAPASTTRVFDAPPHLISMVEWAVLHGLLWVFMGLWWALTPIAATV